MLESLNRKVEIEGFRVVLRPKSWSQNIGRVRRLLVAGTHSHERSRWASWGRESGGSKTPEEEIL